MKLLSLALLPVVFIASCGLFDFIEMIEEVDQDPPLISHTDSGLPLGVYNVIAHGTGMLGAPAAILRATRTVSRLSNESKNNIMAGVKAALDVAPQDLDVRNSAIEKSVLDNRGNVELADAIMVKAESEVPVPGTLTPPEGSGLKESIYRAIVAGPIITKRKNGLMGAVKERLEIFENRKKNKNLTATPFEQGRRHTEIANAVKNHGGLNDILTAAIVKQINAEYQLPFILIKCHEAHLPTKEICDAMRQADGIAASDDDDRIERKNAMILGVRHAIDTHTKQQDSRDAAIRLAVVSNGGDEALSVKIKNLVDAAKPILITTLKSFADSGIGDLKRIIKGPDAQDLYQSIIDNNALSDDEKNAKMAVVVKAILELSPSDSGDTQADSLKEKIKPKAADGSEMVDLFADKIIAIATLAVGIVNKPATWDTDMDPMQFGTLGNSIWGQMPFNQVDWPTFTFKVEDGEELVICTQLRAAYPKYAKASIALYSDKACLAERWPKIRPDFEPNPAEIAYCLKVSITRFSLLRHCHGKDIKGKDNKAAED